MTPAVTDPCRPSVGTTPSDDVELVVKCCEVLPTVSGCGSTEAREVDAAKQTHR
jgi:hypothetical protein